jgi:hypothetical protein
MDRGELAVALILASTACEVLAQHVILEFFDRRDASDVGAAVVKLLASYSLANDRVRGIYDALTNDDLTRREFWPSFKELARLRNEVIHGEEPILLPNAVGEAFQGAYALQNHLIAVLINLPSSVRSTA